MPTQRLLDPDGLGHASAPSPRCAPALPLRKQNPSLYPHGVATVSGSIGSQSQPCRFTDTDTQRHKDMGRQASSQIDGQGGNKQVDWQA
eukprot:5955027-Alexandrium_andersonii.AAC.1